MATVAVAGTMIVDGTAIAAGGATAAGTETAATVVTGTGHIGAAPIMAGATRVAGLSGAGTTAFASAAERPGIFWAAVVAAARFSGRLDVFGRTIQAQQPKPEGLYVQCSVHIGNVSDPS